MSEQKLFTKDFTLVLIGQIISLFGNAILRFALPLYLLRQTGSSTLYGIVTACSFLPMISCSHYIIKKKFFQVKFQIHSFSEKQNKLHTIKKPIILTLIQ